MTNKLINPNVALAIFAAASLTFLANMAILAAAFARFGWTPPTWKILGANVICYGGAALIGTAVWRFWPRKGAKA